MIYLDLDSIEKDQPLDLIPLGTMIKFDMDAIPFCHMFRVVGTDSRNSVSFPRGNHSFGIREYKVISHIHSNITKNASIFHWYELHLWSSMDQQKLISKRKNWNGECVEYLSEFPPMMISFTHNHLKELI